MRLQIGRSSRQACPNDSFGVSQPFLQQRVCRLEQRWVRDRSSLLARESGLGARFVTRAEKQLAQGAPAAREVRFELNGVAQSLHCLCISAERSQGQTQLVVCQSGARKSGREGSQQCMRRCYFAESPLRGSDDQDGAGISWGLLQESLRLPARLRRVRSQQLRG